jgi:serine/threonine protein kinase
MTGRTISHYQMTERLGSGGMGEIYKAQDTRLNRTVAIKVLTAAQAGTGERRRRFLQEAQAASALNHPNIITIHDIVSEGDSDFLVMEFVAGKTLGELTPKGGLPLRLVLSYGVQIAEALEAAHAAGIVHRDLKPGNVMVAGQTEDGRPGLVKLLDFGLAKLTAPSPPTVLGDETATLERAPLTVEGSILGTVSYMSPEQAEGKPVDARSDIFAFGAILHEMVTGERAFAGDSAISTLTSILRDEVRPLRQFSANVPPVLESIVARCLRKNREERWQSIGEVRAALALLKRDSDSGILYAPPPIPPAPQRAKRSLWRVPLLIALTGVLVVGGLVVMAGLAILWAIFHHSSKSYVPSAVTIETGKPESHSRGRSKRGLLTNDDVLEMVNADVPPKVIVEQIRSSKTRFDLSTSEIIRLTEGDVPAEVIEAMRKATPSAAAPATAAGRTASALAGAAPPADAGPAAPEAPAAPEILAGTVPESRMVAVLDRLPIPIRLAEDVPADAPAGTPLHFTVMHDFHAHGTVVVAGGAVVTGEIVEAERKGLLHGNRVMFRLKDVETTGGGKLALRASSSRNEDSRRMEPIGAPRRSREVAAAAGEVYLAYVDGDQTVAVKR